MKQTIALCTISLFSVAAVAAANPPPAPVTTVKVGPQSLLADESGMTLYVFDVDTSSTSQCYNACAGAWPAEAVPSSAGISAPFATSTRTDGKIQLTLNNRPLYHYAGDKKSGDIAGNGLGGVWHVVPF